VSEGVPIGGCFVRMIIALTVIASLAGIAVIASICMQNASPDAGFSAAMGGGGGDSSSRKSGHDLMLERVLKFSAVIWVVSCLLLAVLESHRGGL
jgi:protein translocase SecG subunit